jgi:hypothetical protein
MDRTLCPLTRAPVVALSAAEAPDAVVEEEPPTSSPTPRHSVGDAHAIPMKVLISDKFCTAAPTGDGTPSASTRRLDTPARRRDALQLRRARRR